MSDPAVLITRPRGQADTLAEAVSAAGYHPVLQPLLELEALAPQPWQQAFVEALDGYQHIIFISSNAVNFGMLWISPLWPELPAGPNYYAIGDGSAAALATFGIAPQQPAVDMSSEGLLALPSLQKVAGQGVLIVKGEGGRETLRTVLRQRGATVDELAAYRRQCPSLGEGELAALLQQTRCQAILISSGEGLDNMVSLLDDTALAWVRKLSLIVPGRRVAERARQAGFADVSEASNATDSAMLLALRERLVPEG